MRCLAMGSNDNELHKSLRVTKVDARTVGYPQSVGFDTKRNLIKVVRHVIWLNSMNQTT